MAIDASDVIVFKSIRFRVSTLIRYVCVFICIHFQQRFQIDAFSVNTLSVFERISVDGRPKRIEMYAFSNENALVWTGPNSGYSALQYKVSLNIFHSNTEPIILTIGSPNTHASGSVLFTI